MSDFVGNKKVDHIVASLLPTGEGEHTTLNIEAGSAYALMLNDQVLGSEESGEGAFDFKVDGHRKGVVSYVRIITAKSPPVGRLWTLSGLSTIGFIDNLISEIHLILAHLII